MDKAIIVSAFPGMGKTYMVLNREDKFRGLRIKDSDSSEFSWIVNEDGTKVRNPEFPNNYIEHIKSIIDKYDIIFVSSHKPVRDALENAKIEFFCLKPNHNYTNGSNLKPGAESYVEERIRSRKTGINNDNFCTLIKDNWDSWLTGIDEQGEESDYVRVITCKTVADFVSDYLKTAHRYRPLDIRH